jgi:DNA (cytosine-5)-methyltransferase 1
MKTFASLFSGGGGADLGAIAAELTHLWGIEQNPNIAEVCRQNIGTCHNIDILDADPASLDRPDWIHASPPCQSFSAANAKKGEKDNDIKLARKVAEFIEVLKPEYFSLENVRAYRGSVAFHIIVNALNVNGYHCNTEVINAMNYSVPQSRERLFLVAYRGDYRWDFDVFNHSGCGWVGWYEAIVNLLPFDQDGLYLKGDIPTWDSVDISFLPHDTQRGITEGGILALETIGKPSLRKAITALHYEPIWTIRALSDEHWWKFRWFAYGLTGLSTIEMAARLQSFPDWYKFPSKKALAGTIIGNSVPPLMMQKIIEATINYEKH